jgi:hypothetical protein
MTIEYMFRMPFLNRETVVIALFRAIIGIVLTAMAAPLILSVILFGKLVVAYPVAPLIIAASVIGGLPISSAAALINAAIVSMLAWFRADALPISLASGGLIGLWARAVVVQKRIGIGPETGTTSLDELFPFAATGAVMGGVYWLIAILPQRRQRLVQESVKRRDLDQAAQDTGIRKRGRRIPWDGRVPPD